MFSIDKSVPVNGNLKPGDPALTRDHIWEGLLMKAYDAKPFVHLMTKCEVTREFEDGIEGDIVFRGMGLTERLTFYPKTKVEFLRTKGIEMGTITNEIVEDSAGGLHLRFAFSLERSDMKPGALRKKNSSPAMPRVISFRCRRPSILCGNSCARVDSGFASSPSGSAGTQTVFRLTRHGEF